MSGFTSSRMVSATRKDHRCPYCGKVIGKGSRGILYESGIFDGSWFSRHTCPECEATIDRFWLYADPYGEGVLDYEVREMHDEFARNIKDEPYVPNATRRSDGSVMYVSCGCCGHMFSRVGRWLMPDELPTICPSCGTLIAKVDEGQMGEYEPPWMRKTGSGSA